MSHVADRDLRQVWYGFVDAVAPTRPALHNYCRRLTSNLWDAEDLVQDTLVRAFGRRGVTYPGIRNPKSHLLRTATNIWIDAMRRRDAERLVLASHAKESLASSMLS